MPVAMLRLLSAALATGLALLEAGPVAAACAFQVTPRAVGPISAAMPFDTKALKIRLPHCEIRHGRDSTEGEPADVITVHAGKIHLLTLWPDGKGGIFSVIVESPSVRNALGPGPGRSFNEIRRRYGIGECDPGLEDFAGTVICADERAANIVYIFTGQWDGPDGALPPRSVLQHWLLNRVVWTPPR